MTLTTTDIEGASEWLNGILPEYMRTGNLDTVRQALCLAAKVLGLPSDEMMSVGYSAWHDGKSHNEIYKTMIKQLLKEVENA